MTSAQLFVEAVDTAGVLLRAGATWLVLVALAATLALYAVIAVAWTVCRWAWLGVRRGRAGVWRPWRGFRGRAASRPLPGPHTPA